MHILKVLRLTACGILFSAVISPCLLADEWNRKTVATFNEPVQLPGQLLMPGTYVFRLADSPTCRHIVEVWTGDGRQLIAIEMAIPEVRAEATDEPVFEFDERPADQPEALRSWFYPGALTGEEFVYWDHR